MESIISEIYHLWGSCFFSKYFKIWCRSQKWRKRFIKCFQSRRQYHLNWLCWTLIFAEREYLSSCKQTVNMLTNSLKIPDTTKTEFFALKFSQSDEKIWKNYFWAELSSVSKPLRCWLSINVVTRAFLDL